MGLIGVSWLLDADDHRLGPGQVLDIGPAKARRLQPLLALRAGVVEAIGQLDQHVQAHQQPEDVLAAVVVDDRVIADDRTLVWERPVGLVDQQALGVQAPVVQDVAEHQHVGGRQLVDQEVARLEPQAPG